MSTETLERVFKITPRHIGPTWQENPDWNGVSLLGPHGKYVLPEFSLGYEMWAWVRENLLHPESTPDNQMPFTPTFEQYRIGLWWYAVDERGRFIFRKGIIQRMKGHGKDPLAAVFAAFEMLGPCRFRGWALKDMPERGLDPRGNPVVKRGMPVGQQNPNAWVQIAAVSKTQTQNTMNLFPGLLSDSCKAAAGMRADSIGATKVTSFKGQRQIQAVTSNPRALEGNRPSLVIKNETEHWVEANRGIEMSRAIDRNAAKSKNGAARALSICNAPEPSEESVGGSERDAAMAVLEGNAIDTGVMYDSLEVEPEIGIEPPGYDQIEDDEEREALIRAWLAAIIRVTRGDSTWIDVERITNEILDVNNPASQSRRFYLNQPVASEDAWVLPEAVNLSIDPIAKAARTPGMADHMRCGWAQVRPDEPVVVFFDGSMSDDSTVLIGCRLSDGYCFTIGIWSSPAQKRQRNIYLVPRGQVDSRVTEMFDRFKVVAFFADPSHTKDDDGVRYWDGMIDDWHRRYKHKLIYHAVKGGINPHSIMWDMASPDRTKQFITAAELTVAELEAKDENGELHPTFTHDGHPELMKHLKNVKRSPGPWGVGMRKDGPESPRKIDAGVALVGARMLRRLVLNAEPEEKQAKTGWAYGV